MLFKKNIFDYIYRDGDMGYFGLSYKGPKGENGSNEPILPIPVKYLLEPTHPPLPLVQPPLLKPPLHQQLPQTRGQNKPIQRIKMRRLKREMLSALQ